MRFRLMMMSAVLGLVLATAQPLALANHNQATFYGAWWHTGERTVVWHFDNDFPTGNRRDRVKDGATKWNQQNQSMTFSFNSTDTNNQSFSGCAGTLDKSTVFWESITDPPGVDVLGETSHCVLVSDSTHLTQFKMHFDTGNSWYSGTASDPPGNSDADLWSVATHEMGHATGFGTGSNIHFQGGVCTSPPSNTDQTMCPSIPLDASWWRSLESHDKSVFGDRY